MDHSAKAETTFGDLEADERFQKLKRSLKLAMLKANNRKMSEEEVDTPVSLPTLSSINGDAFNSSCATLSRTSLRSEVLASSNNLRNLLLRKPTFYNTNQKQIATSSVKQYDIKHNNDIDRLIMPPPDTFAISHASKKPMNTLSDRENTAPVALNSSDQSSAANTFSSKSTSTRMSSNINGDKKHLSTDRVFSNWKVMLDEKLELRIKGTYNGSRVYSKPIVRRYSAKCVESKFKYKYHLEGNIVDERNDLPDYIRGKFYNGFPDDWENVYQVWRTYCIQRCPVTFHWPTPITDSDDDLISEVTDFTYMYKNKTKVASAAERYKPVKHAEVPEKSIARSLDEEKQYHSDHHQQSNKQNSTSGKSVSEFREDVVPAPQTLVEISNQLDPNLSSEFVIRKIRYLKDLVREDQMNIIINNLEHENCSPVYVNKVLALLDDLDFVMTYRTRSSCDESSVVPASRETSKSGVTSQRVSARNSDRANSDECESETLAQKRYAYSGDPKRESTPHSSKSNEAECDESGDEIYLGVPKVSFDQVLKTREALGKTHRRRERKRKACTDAANARNNTAETVKYKSVPTPVTNSTRELPFESCVSVTEDEAEAVDARKSHEAALVRKQQETRQQQIFSHYQENETNFDACRRAHKPEKHTEDARCYNPPEIRRSNEYASVFAQEQNFPHKSKRDGQFIPDVDFAKSDHDAANEEAYVKTPLGGATSVSRVDSDQEGANTKSNNPPKSSHVSRRSRTELAGETKDETAEKRLKPTIISSIPVNLNLKICNTSSRSENNSDVSIIVDDRAEQRNANIRPTETSPRKRPPNAASASDIRSKTMSDGKKETRSATNDRRETNGTGPAFTSTKPMTSQNGHSASSRKETKSVNSASTKPIANQNGIPKDAEAGLRGIKLLTAWSPKVICYPQSKSKLGLIFEGKLLNEAGHVVHRKFSTGVVLKRLSAKLIETVDHKLYELYGSFNDRKHNFPKELARLCRNGCPTRIEEFCLAWKTLLNDDVQKVTAALHETSVDLLNTAVSSRGRKILPPLCYWTGERISLKDNNLIYNPGNSNDSLVSLSERSKTISSIEEKEKPKTESKKPTKKQDKQQPSPKSNIDTNKNSTGNEKSSDKASTAPKRKKSTRKSAINSKQRITQHILRMAVSSSSSSSEEEQEPSSPKRARGSQSNTNESAPSRHKNVETQQTAPSRTVCHAEASPPRESVHEITCIYLKSVQPEDFLSEDQASVM